MIPLRDIKLKPSKPAPSQPAACRECHDTGYTGDGLPSNMREVLERFIPCPCPAGDWFRAELAIRGERCDAPGCAAGAVEAPARCRLCRMHALAAVGAWRRAGGVVGPREWVAAVRSVV